MIPEIKPQAVPERPRSRSLWHAQQAGLPVRMAYTIAETSLYSGIPAATLKAAIRRGELQAKTPNGNMRGARITVASMDEWMASDLSGARS